jgi:hypothetical protein
MLTVRFDEMEERKRGREEERKRGREEERKREVSADC